MKKIIENKFALFAVAIVIVIAAAVVYSYTAVGGKPAIQVSPLSYDFGNIPQETVSHTFEVRNTGSSILEISAVSTSCGCTTASVESTSIAPNQSTNLVVRFDPNSMAEAIVGNVFRIVYIKSNDPEKPEVEIEITANVVREL